MATSATTALKASKKALRTSLKPLLASIPVSVLDCQSEKAFASLTTFAPYMRAKRLSIYLSMPSGEIQTTSIVRHALQNGKAVFVPYLYPSENQDGNTPKKVMDMVRLKDLEDYEGLKRDSWGIPTISKESVAQRERILDDAGRGEVGLDLILLPGLAFEVLGAGNGVKRLGHGRGFYDYFLHRYRDTYEKEVVGNTLLLYGLTLEEQIMGGPGGNDVPVGELDVLIDGLVVGDGRIIDTRG